MNNKYLLTALFFLLTATLVTSQSFEFKKANTKNNSSFRSLSIINDNIAWVGGSNGWIGRTNNGGKSWKFSQVKGYEKVGFRSLYAFDDKRAVIANAGAPANILLTTNGGKTWKVVYTNNNESAFFDGVDFWNDNEGIMYGDPIDGKMLLVATSDGGNTWTEVINRPALETDEASFAASGTGIKCIDKNKLIIATGGVVSRLWVSEDKGETWNNIEPPIIQGEKTTGIYSFATNGTTINLVGGDYTKPPLATKHNVYSNDSGITWQTPASPTRGYRECVTFIEGTTWLTTGPTGTDQSNDDGKNWMPISDEEGFHVLRKARNGSLILVAGGNGQISIIKKQK